MPHGGVPPGITGYLARECQDSLILIAQFVNRFIQLLIFDRIKPRFDSFAMFFFIMLFILAKYQYNY